MKTDIDTLRAMNIGIGDAETRGDRSWLENVLAPQLAFHRANEARTVVDRDEYLAKVAESAERETEIESIHVYGDRAVVTCLVTTRPDGKRFHNVRLFVRREADWKLLGWANEPV